MRPHPLVTCSAMLAAKPADCNLCWEVSRGGERETTEVKRAAFQSRSSLRNPAWWKYVVGLDRQMLSSPSTSASVSTPPSAPPTQFVSHDLMLSA